MAQDIIADIKSQLIGDNDEAQTIVETLLKRQIGYKLLFALNEYGICGDLLIKLYHLNDSDINKLRRNIEFIDLGSFDAKDIRENLALEKPIDFVDTSIFPHDFPTSEYSIWMIPKEKVFQMAVDQAKSFSKRFEQIKGRGCKIRE
ncbi:MAG TPA: hypothetical protein PLC53_02905 [Bacilli bacterium]|nr:hypothetical protein [Bacilli bacterium]